MFHLVSYKWFRRTQYIPKFRGFYKKVGILLGGCLTVKNQWELLTGDDGVLLPGVVVFEVVIVCHCPICN